MNKLKQINKFHANQITKLYDMVRKKHTEGHEFCESCYENDCDYKDYRNQETLELNTKI